MRPEIDFRNNVFISSTSVDLKEWRLVVQDVILRMHQFSIAMEQFGAQDGDAVQVSLKEIASADVAVFIVAWRYGYIPEGSELSVTQLEYEEATRLGIPRLVLQPHL